MVFNNIPCILSALCFFISNIMDIAVGQRMKNAMKSSETTGEEIWSKMKSFDTDFIKGAWDFRRNLASLEQTSHIINLIAWLFFLMPILQLTWYLSDGGKRRVALHATIAGMAITGCTTEVLSRLLNFGLWGTCNWISKWFTLEGWIPDPTNDNGGLSDDTIGWKTLEMIHTVMNGMLFWIDSFEWFCLFIIMCSIYMSYGTISKELPEVTSLKGITKLSLVIAFLCFLDMIADFLRLYDWKFFGPMVFYVTTINTCLLLPSWLVWLSYKNITTTNNHDDAYS